MTQTQQKAQKMRRSAALPLPYKFPAWPKKTTLFNVPFSSCRRCQSQSAVPADQLRLILLQPARNLKGCRNSVSGQGGSLVGRNARGEGPHDSAGAPGEEAQAEAEEKVPPSCSAACKGCCSTPSQLSSSCTNSTRFWLSAMVGVVFCAGLHLPLITPCLLNIETALSVSPRHQRSSSVSLSRKLEHSGPTRFSI